MFCQVCLSGLEAGGFYCSSCGAAVPEHLQSPAPSESRDRIAGERKYLTVLSVDLQRSTDLIAELDPEAAISRLEPALIAMRTAVRRNGGIVSKEGGDGLIALFGAPHADDNHAVMACHAAVDLVRRIELLKDRALRVRIGIHSGYVVAHIIEGDFSSIYEAAGPAVHLVKRLEGVTQAGQILVSESTQLLTDGLVTFEPLPPKLLAGFPAPVPCYKLVELSGMTRWGARSSKGLSSFVGRSEELNTLELAARDAAGKGQIVALVGTSGVGKSRMVHEFGGTLRQRNWQALEAECNPLERAVPYALLKSLLLNALRIIGIDSADEIGVPEQTQSTFSDLWPAALCSVLDREVTDPRWNDLEPLLRRRAIIDVSRALIEKAISGQPTVLLLEDLHWIDDQSETVVEALVSLTAKSPLLVLLTWRTEDTPAWLTRLNVHRIWLRALDSSSASALLDELLGTAAELNNLKAHVLRHTGRVPLFIEEVARQLLGRGILEHGAGRLAATDSAWEALEIPPTVQGVIASRIDRLPKQDKALLQLASVVGPRISPRLLEAVTLIPGAQLQSRLWSLEVLDFLVEPRALAEPEYEFAHDLIREVAYESILRPQREELHHRILIALEVSSLGREKDAADALCHHALHAGDWKKTDRYGHLAAQKALARSAFRDATEYFTIAMDAVDRQPHSVEREQRAIDLRIEARTGLATLGKTEEWFGLCRDAEARSEKIGDEQRRLASVAVRAAALNFYGTPYEAIAAGEQAVALALKSENSTWLSFAEYGLGQAYCVAGRYRDAERCLQRASNGLTSAPEKVPSGTTGSSLLVLCFMMSAINYTSMGEFDEAQAMSKRARDLAEKNDRPYDLIAATYGNAIVQLFHGDLEEAELSLDEAADLSRHNEVRLFLPLILCAFGNLYVQQGRAKDAKNVLLQAKEESRTLGHSASDLLASAYLGPAYGQLGEGDVGLNNVRACQAAARQRGYQGIEALAIFSEAAILSFEGNSNVREAISRLERVIEIATRLESRPLLGSAKGLLSRLLANAGKDAEAKDELVQAIDLFTKSKMTLQLERAKLTLSKFPKS